MCTELDKIKKNLENQEKKVYEKINPILQLYDQDKITKKELIEKLAEVFYSLEKDETLP